MNKLDQSYLYKETKTKEIFQLLVKENIYLSKYEKLFEKV